MGRRGPKGLIETTQVAFRLPVTLLERIDAYGAEMAARAPGVYVSRADAVRVLLGKALDAEDAAKKVSKTEKRR